MILNIPKRSVEFRHYSTTLEFVYHIFKRKSSQMNLEWQQRDNLVKIIGQLEENLEWMKYLFDVSLNTNRHKPNKLKIRIFYICLINNIIFILQLVIYHTTLIFLEGKWNFWCWRNGAMHESKYDIVKLTFTNERLFDLTLTL